MTHPAVEPDDYEAWLDLQAVIEERDREYWAANGEDVDGEEYPLVDPGAFADIEPGNLSHMTEWVSHAAAAELVGCSPSTIEAHLDEIDNRPRHGGRPSLDLASVEAFAARWRVRVAEESERARRRADVIPRGQPPTDQDVWLDATTAALVIGRSEQWVTRLALAERLPATRGGSRRWWFRRHHVEQHAAALAFAIRRRAARR